ncbi:hypothetical protein RKD26_006223 [Streptomyces calvus]
MEDPQQGPALLRHRTDLTAAQARDAFDVMFVAGGRAAMWLLFAVAPAALAGIAVGLRPARTAAGARGKERAGVTSS